MSTSQRLKTLLIKAGLSEAAVDFYLLLRDTPGASVSEIILKLPQSKSTLYRAYEELKNLDLITISHEGEWKNSLVAASFKPLLEKLHNQARSNARLISALRAYEMSGNLSHYSRLPGVEVLNAEETYERYLDLSTMAWDRILSYGNWEGLNNTRRNLIALEKSFISNRLKKGANALVVLTNSGPCTEEIISLDQSEQRRTKHVNEHLKPFWMNLFEGTDYVHLWYQDERSDLFSTFIESKPLAEFYRQQFYAKI